MGAKAIERDWRDLFDLLGAYCLDADGDVGTDERPLAFEPECVLPAQWAAERPLSSLELLMLAVMWQAVYDLNRRESVRPSKRSLRRAVRQRGEWSAARVQRDARRFFSVPPVPLRDGEIRGLDLARICEHFEWDIGAIRRAVGANIPRSPGRRPPGWGCKTGPRRVVVT